MGKRISEGIRRRKMLEKLHNENPNCWICDEPTDIIEVARHITQPDNKAVLQHIYTKYDSERLEPAHNEKRSHLSCFKCAMDYNDAIQASIPIAELHERANRNGEEQSRRKTMDQGVFFTDHLDILSAKDLLNIPCYER